MFQLFHRWKTSKLSLACPHCKELASSEVFRRGRYLAGSAPLRCEHCGGTAPITLWRFEGLSQNPDTLVCGRRARESLLSEPSAH